MASKEDVDILRKKRTQSHSVLSRHMNSLNRHIKERDAPSIFARLKQLKRSFETLEEIHYSYIDLVPEDTVSTEKQWYEDIYTKYCDDIDKANLWLDDNCERPKAKLSATNPTEVSSDAGAGASAKESVSSELATLLRLPQVSIPQFSGDPQSYQRFITAFDEAVGDRVNDDWSKLAHLLQCLSGEALSAVEHCELSGPEGYIEARDILKERFGNRRLIIRCVLDKLQSSKPAVRPKQLRQLVDDVTMAIKQLKRLDALREIDFPPFIMKVADRVHRQVRARWEWYVFDYDEKNNSFPSIQDFAEFLGREARRANHPIVGFDVSRPATTPSKSTSYVTSMQKNVMCKLCSASHVISNCPQFTSMTPHERFAVAKRLRLCYRCLQGGHGIKSCVAQWSCNKPGCDYKHHKLLHFPDKPNTTVADSVASCSSHGSNDVDSQQAGVSNSAKTMQRVYLPIVPVYIKGKLVHALLDTGSTDTFVTEALAVRLGLPRSKTTVKVNTISDKLTMVSDKVSFDICPVYGQGSYHIDKAFVIANIPSQLAGKHIDCAKYPYLYNLPFDHLSSSGPVELLIGNDYPHLIRPLEVRCAEDDVSKPYATRTRLGWTLQGPMDAVSTSHYVASAHHMSVRPEDQDMEKLWRVETEDEDVTSWSVVDHKVNELWESSIKVIDGFYQLPIPWKNEQPCFPNNRHVAMSRLTSTVKKVTKSNMYDRYDLEMTKMLDAGYAEPVPNDMLTRSDGKVWYLPHHAVLSAAKPDKVRIVFDCSATCCGISLNNQCHKGPDLVNKLLHVLLRFRLYQHIVTADIQAMYMQVRVPLEDRDCLRFLWYQGEELREFRMTAHLFGGVWCASSSTFALRQVLRDYEASILVRRAILDSMYVDDLLCSVPSIDHARKLTSEIKEVLAKGGFNLTKFVVNNDDILPSIPDTDRVQISTCYPPDQSSKTLGIQLVIADDEFQYVPASQTDSSANLSKRQLLSVVSSLYDPLGLVLPIIITGRMLFQQATRENIDWDTAVSAQLAAEWDKWKAALSDLCALRFPRCLISDNMLEGLMELHHFCDGSSQAYGACSYLRIVSPHGDIRVVLLQARGRLAPLRSLSIPRLELCAAVLAVKLDVIARRELDIDLVKSTFWTDSQIVLAYIRAQTRRFQVFVANRISFICSNSEMDQWRFIPGKDNPADVITRGCTPARLQKTQWISGPQFLSTHRSQWPDMQEPQSPSISTLELKPTVAYTSSSSLKDPLDTLIEYFSDYHRLVKSVAWLRRFSNARSKTQISLSPITVDELHVAERLILQHAQRQAFDLELSCLTSGKQLPKSSCIRSLSPVLQDGLLVVGGRLKHAALPLPGKYPIILPAHSRVSSLILSDSHSSAHLGVEWTLSHVRRRFWIIKARSQLKRIRRNCVKCQKLFGKPLSQKMSDLPPTRCTPGPVAFVNVGVDCFGPFIIKIGRKTDKRYGCIFTCLTTRAIHLEVLGSLETDTFINAFLRFTARRGWCSTIKSDNGTNLVGAKAELLQAFKQIDKDKVVKFAASRNVDWTFNPPLASHQGGIWERMIRTVRKVLVAILGKAPLTEEVLSTAFCEVEGIINSRPLTKCSDDPSDEEPLTPNHFLMMEGNFSVDWGKFVTAHEHRRRWCHAQCLVNHFWKRWLREYLSILQIRQKWTDHSDNLKVGNLVFVMDESAPRGSWPLGLVIQIQPSRDGVVRSVKLKVRNTILVRPITKLVPLEY